MLVISTLPIHYGTRSTESVYTKLNNNSLYMMKMIEAKTTVSLKVPGEYTMAAPSVPWRKSARGTGIS